MSRSTFSMPISVSRTSRALITLSAAAIVAVVAGCATAPTNSTAAAPASNALYCHKERLYTASGDLVCNWSDSVEAACKDNTQASRVAASSLKDAPSDSRLCPSGQKLVMATRK